jgi:2-keto-4-pentenoate hydratase/2-oxohepta-3-ene-1,7-dioic acid hydratase in catechol pathway
MRLASFHSAGLDRVGLEISPGTLIDVVTAIDAADLDVKPPLDMLDLIRRGAPMLAAIERARAYAVAMPDRVPRHSCDAIRWHAPVRSPSKVVCLALNNRALDAIKIRAPTDHPAFFLKPSTAVTGHLCAIQLRESYGLTHPEPELGVVIAQTLKNVSPQEAMRGVFGYTIVNDITSVGMREEDSFSVRYFKPGDTAGAVSVGEAHTTYPGRYKASDTFAPMGPFVVTADEVPDPAALKIECRLGDRLIAADHTKNYVWGVPQALSHISRTMTLLPGDVVSMGTAVGGDADDPSAPNVPGVTRINLVGAAAKVSITISRLGTLVNSIQMV